MQKNAEAPNDRRLLLTGLLLNVGLFVVEIITGLLTRFMGMGLLADALVFGRAL